MKSLTAALPMAVALAAAPASARPVSIGLDVPGLSLGLLLEDDASKGQPAPPNAQPPAPQTPQVSGDQPDVVTLRDGRVYRGRILYQVQGGLLFSDPRFPQSFVIPLGDVANVTHPGGPVVPPQPSGITAQRLMLESQLRDLQLRLDSLSVFPAIGTMAGGAISIGIGIMLYALYNTSTCSNTVPPVCVADPNAQTNAIIFGLLAGIPGAVALILGTLELISVTNRQAEIQSQIGQIRQSLQQLSVQQQAGVAPPRTPPPLITLRF
jgi:hypothetical protein